jgi:nucleoside-diphosphate-sugar epimerase
MTKRIVFTGGTGKAGRHAVPQLLSKGYSILNVDLKPLDLPGVNTLIADLTDGGQAFNALSQHFGFEGYDAGKVASRPDAVVHFAAIPRVLIEPDNVTFAANVVSTYNVIEGDETRCAQSDRRVE